MSGWNILVDQIKNGIFYGCALSLSLLFFMFGDGEGILSLILYLLGWIVLIGTAAVCLLGAVQTTIALVTLPLTIPLYFSKETDKGDKLFLDLSTLLGTLVNLSIVLASYQILQQFGIFALPEFFPFGNIFGIYNFKFPN